MMLMVGIFRNTALHQLILLLICCVNAHRSIIDGTIRDSQCDAHELDRVNEKLRPLLGKLVKTTFFKFYRVNLFKDCPFWKDALKCNNQNCGVEVADEASSPF